MIKKLTQIFTLILIVLILFFLYSANEYNKEYKKLKITEQELGVAYNSLQELYYECDTYLHNIDIIHRYSVEYDVPIEVILAIMKIESNFNESALSHTNDYGLMQINEVHLKELENKLDILEIDKNVECGVSLLSSLKKEKDELHFIFNSYNMGQRGYMDYIKKTGRISREYSKKGIEYVNKLKGGK